MAGVGKLLKQAAKMQKRMETLQSELAAKEIEVSSGGGAVKVRVSLSQEVRGIELDPELLKEPKQIIEESLLEALREALEQARQQNEAAVNELTQSLQVPGMPSLF